MQYKYITCQLPSNGLLYPTKEIHLRAKTIFDIKTLLGNAAYMLKSEIDTLNNCIDPNDNVNVYNLVNQDVVYLLYKLRSMSDDSLNIEYKGENYIAKLSELEIKILESWDNTFELPESKIKGVLAYTPIKNIFGLANQQAEFVKKYPDYHGDVANTVMLLNSIEMIGEFTDKDHIRNALENLSWKDSLYLIKKIEELNQLSFGIVEEVKTVDKEGKKITIPIKITEEFFRPTI